MRVFRSSSPWAGLWLVAGSVLAQTPATHPPAAPFRSAFEGYQPFTDQPVAPWKQSNDTVGAIGGWRAYAREAAGEPATPAPGSKAAPARHDAGQAPAPAQPHRHPHGGHR